MSPSKIAPQNIWPPGTSTWKLPSNTKKNKAKMVNFVPSPIDFETQISAP